MKKKLTPYIVQLIRKGEKISLISDAGTPAISDPGLVLLKECIKKKIKIFPIPGVSAVTTAISISSFDEKYFFYGFLPKKIKELEKLASDFKKYNFNIVFFIPALKINFYVKFFKKHFFDRKILIAREMTKIHETFYRENIENLKNFGNNFKGELTVVLSKKEEKYNLKTENFDEDKLKVEIKMYLKRYSLKDVVNLVTEKYKLSEKKVYSLCLKINR